MGIFRSTEPYGAELLETKSINSVCCLPLFHVSGLMQVIRAIVSQGQILFCHLNDLEKASEAVVIKDFCVSLVPTQLNAYLLEMRFPENESIQSDLFRWRPCRWSSFV